MVSHFPFFMFVDGDIRGEGRSWGFGNCVLAQHCKVCTCRMNLTGARSLIDIHSFSVVMGFSKY
jgi:hypothetical protein